MTHICVGNLTIIGSNNGLSPGRRQAIIWTNDGILLIGPLGTNFSELLIEIQIFSFKKKHLKVSSAKWRPFCLGLNELTIEACWPHQHNPLPVIPEPIYLFNWTPRAKQQNQISASILCLYHMGHNYVYDIFLFQLHFQNPLPVVN